MFSFIGLVVWFCFFVDVFIFDGVFLFEVLFIIEVHLKYIFVVVVCFYFIPQPRTIFNSVSGSVAWLVGATKIGLTNRVSKNIFPTLGFAYTNVFVLQTDLWIPLFRQNNVSAFQYVCN